ncbi:Glycine/betaine/L-proline ABC transporter ATP-binding subunit [Pseudomonas savastanoi pv. glycinea]|nr:Glycine/betaine/L-proline ABC transporter ATP-binding subunit [Pseudomonas savastanoi pv. glycinea]
MCRLVDGQRRRLLRRDSLDTGNDDPRVHFRADLVQSIRTDRPYRRPRAFHPAQVGPDGFRHPFVSADPQPALLAGNHGNPGAGALRHAGVCRHRRAAGHHCRAQAAVLHHHPAIARSDADCSHVRLSDPDPYAIRSGRSARPDLDRGLRHCCTDSPDVSGHPRCTPGIAGRRQGLRLVAPPVADPHRTALRHAQHRCRDHPVHHAVVVDGGDCRAGRCRWSRQTRGQRTEHSRYRARLRSRSGNRIAGHHARPYLQTTRSQGRVRRMSIIKFDKVDVIFSRDPREALKLLDEGLTRDQILKKTGQIVGVENASLDIEKGEICVLMGLSGSGKSSLLRCINGLNTVSRGSLFVEHEGSQINIANCSAAELKMMRTKRIAMVFQKFALMPWLTVRENISFGLEMQGRPEKERRKLVDEKLELVGLTQWRNKKPDELSGGMQQRVGLARALAMDADILLMDEPFSALDPLIRQGLQDELLALQSKLSKTIVFVSHDLDEALKLGSRIAIMKDGRIVQYSVPEQIVLNPADEYVRTFVAHTNPLNVLCGRSLMRTVDECTHVNDSVCLDPSGDSWLDLAEGNVIKGARQGATPLDLQNWTPGQDVGTLDRCPTLVHSNIGMRDALQIRYQTGNKLVLQDGNKVVGILGDTELYHALLGKNHG